jgi:hypothetical protein
MEPDRRYQRRAGFSRSEWICGALQKGLVFLTYFYYVALTIGGGDMDNVNRIVLILFLFTIQQAFAQSIVLYTDDFLTTPVGWTVQNNYPYISTFNFGPLGASFFMSIKQTWPAMYSLSMFNPSVAVVPFGIDHLNLYASQQGHTGTFGAWATLRIDLMVNGSVVETIYSVNDPLTVEDPINIDIIPSEFGCMPADTVGFLIRSQLLSQMDPRDLYWAGIIRWHVTDFTLTAYDEAALQRLSWGEIKTVFD